MLKEPPPIPHPEGTFIGKIIEVKEPKASSIKRYQYHIRILIRTLEYDKPIFSGIGGLYPAVAHFIYGLKEDIEGRTVRIRVRHHKVGPNDEDVRMVYAVVDILEIFPK